MTWRELFIAVFGISLLAVGFVWIGKWNNHRNLQHQCQTSLRAIGQALSAYSQMLQLSRLPHSFEPLPEFVRGKGPPDGTPPTAEELNRRRNRFRPMFLCAAIHREPNADVQNLNVDYAFPAAGMKRLDQLPPEMVVVYETACRHRGGMNVLFASGAVRWLNAEESAAVLDDLAAGKNPPPSLMVKK